MVLQTKIWVHLTTLFGLLNPGAPWIWAQLYSIEAIPICVFLHTSRIEDEPTQPVTTQMTMFHVFALK
jgi:hypothetical protein